MHKGFTLIETLVAMSIGVIIMIAIGTFARNIFFNNSVQSGSFSTAQDARNITRTMVSELRGASPGSDGSYPIVAAGTSTITFFSDINGDGLKEKIRYYLATTTLKKGVITPTGSPLAYTGSEVTSILAYNVRNTASTSILNYYDDNFTGTSSPLTQPVDVSTVRLVQVNLILDADPNRSPLPRTYTSAATLRNLKDNL